jgi:hypothetical protein
MPHPPGVYRLQDKFLTVIESASFQVPRGGRGMSTGVFAL